MREVYDVYAALEPWSGRVPACARGEAGYRHNDVDSCYPVQLFHDSGKGWGLRARRAAERGEFVALYLGEVVSAREARRRWAEYDCRHANYLLVAREYMCALAPPGRMVTRTAPDAELHRESKHAWVATYVDATRIGNEARFINHSCEPNLAGLLVRDVCSAALTHPPHALWHTWHR